jgi:SPP1 gp7 family putative phage head morphogenesis protein
MRLKRTLRNPKMAELRMRALLRRLVADMSADFAALVPEARADSDAWAIAANSGELAIARSVIEALRTIRRLRGNGAKGLSVTPPSDALPAEIDRVRLARVIVKAPIFATAAAAEGLHVSKIVSEFIVAVGKRLIALDASGILDRIAEQGAKAVRRDLAKKIGVRLNASPAEQAASAAFRTQSLARITSLTSSQTQRLGEMLAVEPYMHPSVLRGRIKSEFDVSRSKADLLARDQVLTHAANVRQARMVEIGIREYIWRTSQDERVREEHAALEGQRFSWDNPPDVGHPGEDIQCRCTPDPILPDVFPQLPE